MDVTELSKVLEQGLLENRSASSTPKKSFTMPSLNNFSPRITRSQVHKKEKLKNVECSSLTLQGRVKNKYENEIKKIYLNKKTKVLHKNLETIYEDPLWKKGNTLLLGTNKVKRSIYLDREFRITSKAKSKLRKSKIKRLGNKLKLIKMTDDEFKTKMLNIENYLNETDSEFNCNEESSCGDLKINFDANIEPSKSFDILSFEKNANVNIKSNDNEDFAKNNRKLNFSHLEFGSNELKTESMISF